MKQIMLILSALLAFGAAAQSSAAIKWHPGHYVWLDPHDTQSAHFKHIDEIASVSSIKGVEILLSWAELEKAKGVYDFSKIDAYLSKLKSLAVAKRLVVRIKDRNFNGGSAGIVPDYLRKDAVYNGGIAPMAYGYVARIWEQPVNDRLIALYRALGSRYNSNPYLEAFHTEETSISFTTAPKGYSIGALTNQYYRFIAAAHDTMPNTGLILGANFLGSDANMQAVLQSLIEQPLGVGGINNIPNKLGQSQRVWTGVTGADFTTALALANTVEDLDLGGSHGNFTPKQHYDWASKTLKVNYMFWIRNTWMGGSAQRWSTGILPFLKTNPALRTGCPTSYGSCNTH